MTIRTVTDFDRSLLGGFEIVEIPGWYGIGKTAATLRCRARECHYRKKLKGIIDLGEILAYAVNHREQCKRSIPGKTHHIEPAVRILSVEKEGKTMSVPKTTGKVDFASALEAIKDGLRVTREGWNGKNMYLGLSDPRDSNELGGMTLPFIYMYTAQGDYVPWVASQTDLFAEDWSILD